MKLNRFIALIATLLFLITGCTHENNSAIQKNNNNKEDRISTTEDQIIDDVEKKEFSYLNDLSEEELQAYENFSADKDPQHLKKFTPEKVFLVYIHSAVIDDIEAIYSLTFDNGDLPNFTDFKTKYYKKLNISNLEMALDFRYYNSITAQKVEENSDEVTVDLRVSIGTFGASVIHGLEKQNGVWKVKILDRLQP